MLTRHQFEEIAAIIAKVEDPTTRATLAVSLANALIKSNPRFDKIKFLEACNAR